VENKNKIKKQNKELYNGFVFCSPSIEIPVTKLKNKQVLSFNEKQKRNKQRANKRTKKQETVRDIMQHI
jgi:hypothetical protein